MEPPLNVSMQLCLLRQAHERLSSRSSDAASRSAGYRKPAAPRHHALPDGAAVARAAALDTALRGSSERWREELRQLEEEAAGRHADLLDAEAEREAQQEVLARQAEEEVATSAALRRRQREAVFGEHRRRAAADRRRAFEAAQHRREMERTASAAAQRKLLARELAAARAASAERSDDLLREALQGIHDTQRGRLERTAQLQDSITSELNGHLVQYRAAVERLKQNDEAWAEHRAQQTGAAAEVARVSRERMDGLLASDLPAADARAGRPAGADRTVPAASAPAAPRSPEPSKEVGRGLSRSVSLAEELDSAASSVRRRRYAPLPSGTHPDDVEARDRRRRDVILQTSDARRRRDMDSERRGKVRKERDKREYDERQRVRDSWFEKPRSPPLALRAFSCEFNLRSLRSELEAQLQDTDAD